MSKHPRRKVAIRFAVLAAISPSLAACEQSVGTGGDDPGPAFEAPRDRIELLPFRIRLARLAQIAGVAEDASVLQLVRDNATGLGDHDFASGTPASDQWTASRMALWVKAIEPVCAAPEFRALYPSLPGSAGDLIAAAWGRPATAQDLAAVDDGLGGVALDGEEIYQASCLAILSSLEFVAR